jgi:hypothetical protein
MHTFGATYPFIGSVIVHPESAQEGNGFNNLVGVFGGLRCSEEAQKDVAVRTATHIPLSAVCDEGLLGFESFQHWCHILVPTKQSQSGYGFCRVVGVR